MTLHVRLLSWILINKQLSFLSPETVNVFKSFA